jgi:ATP-binding cassette subfamily B protein
MLKTLGAELKEFKKASIATPLFMLIEVLMETIIPFLMAKIIDVGIYGENQSYIIKMGLLMIACALISLFGGWMGAKYGAKASMGFGRN